MLFQKHRKRRLIYNDDAYQQTDQRVSLRTRLPPRKPWYNITDEQSFVDARTTPTFGTYVDTYVWCVGNGCEPPWGAWGQKYRGPVWPVLRSSTRATNLIVDACHTEGMEIWGSLRMNDLHDAGCDLEETNDPLKGQHPEYLIGKSEDLELPQERIERSLVTAFNFERPEVRQYRLDFINQNAAVHDFDGYELDFTRFIWNFPLGKERELAPLMTDFVRDVRSGLSTIGNKRGRPYTLVVHVMDSVETSLGLGYDVDTWLSEGLVDVLVVGLGYMPFTLDLESWQALGERYGVPIYPSLNPRKPFHEMIGRVSASHEYIRAAAAWWWQNDVDGIYLFNLFTQEDVWGLDKEDTYAPLRDIGDLTSLAGKDKLYGIDAGGRGFDQGSEVATLPIPLDTFERRLPLNMGLDAEDSNARFKIQAWTSGGTPDMDVWMRLNHTLLEPDWQDGRLTVVVPVGVMRVGRNDLTVWCGSELDKTDSPIVVRDVWISVDYGTNRVGSRGGAEVLDGLQVGLSRDD